MKNSIKYILLIIWIALNTLCCNPRVKPTSFNQSFDSIATEKIDSIGNELIKTREALGFSIAVLHKRDTLYAKGFGFRDINKSKPFTSELAFAFAPIASHNQNKES